MAKVQDWPERLASERKTAGISGNERLDHPIGCEIDVTILGHMTPHGQFPSRRSSDREPVGAGIHRLNPFGRGRTPECP
jgi:hypothetical protein